MIDSKKMQSKDGFDLVLNIDYDHWTEPQQHDNYTAKQIEAWEKDEWWFIFAEVVASKSGIELGSSGYGGIEFGYFTSTDEQDQITNQSHITIDDIEDYAGFELADTAMTEALIKLAELLKGAN
jgi:hypothetical protein